LSAPAAELASAKAAGLFTGTLGVDFDGTPSLSADGRYIAFSSSSPNLTPGDPNITDSVFVHDRVSGTTTLVDVIPGSNTTGNGSSDSPSISADGRYIAFRSSASNLVANDTNGATRDVFVRDLVAGTTTLVSVNAAGTGSGNSSSDAPVISADGNIVAFRSFASNLV
jgi:Tol biopolymer transport system component